MYTLLRVAVALIIGAPTIAQARGIAKSKAAAEPSKAVRTDLR